MENLASLISSIGFPCTFCIILFYFMQKEQRAMSEAIHDLKEAIVVLTERLKKGDEKDEV